MGDYLITAIAEKKQPGRPRAVEAWLRHIARAETDSCVEFPFQRNALGYGLYVATTGRRNRKKRRAHNFVCELVHGEAPEGHIALHSCDNPSCVNKRHLRWGLPRDNTADMLSRGREARGRRIPHAKLDPATVREIRARAAAGEQQKHIALDIGMARSVVCEVVNRKAWKHVK